MFTERHRLFGLYSQVVEGKDWAVKRVVITGGQGDLGQEIAREFFSNGWDVCAPGRDELDVLDHGMVAKFFEEQPCDLLVCCAGVVWDQPIYLLNEVDWDDVMNTNYHGAKQCSEHAIGGMKGQGHVVFISSYAALSPETGQSAYCVSKSCLLGLTKDLARRFGSYGIRVNAILPGFMETKMTEKVTDKRKDEVKNSHVLRELNQAACVARFVRFLEEELPFTSGQIFQLDSRVRLENDDFL